MPTCYAIRHADKLFGDFYNPHLRHQDEPISALGQQQALKLARFFAEKPISAIYISEYQRTHQTIQPVAECLGLTPTVDERLNEIDNGCIESLSDAEIQTRYPEVWSAYRERTSDFRFPDGETGAEVQQRISSFLAEKSHMYPSGQIILVAHDGLIRLLMCAILGLPVTARWNFQVDFCGITEIAYQPAYDTWKLIRFNQICG
jgi:broad specificity phosphatase PhoE